MQQIKQSLNIDDTYTKLYRRPTRADEMTKVKEQVPLVEGLNFMADILHLPTDAFGYSKLLVVVDIANDEFDIEKLKGETSEEVLSHSPRTAVQALKVRSTNTYMITAFIIEWHE